MKMAVKLTRVLALFCVFCVFLTAAGAFNYNSVKTWADNIGQILSKTFKDATGYAELKKSYTDAPQLSVTEKNGTSLADKMKTKLESVLQKKIKAIKRLAPKAEELRKNYTYDASLKETSYHNSKSLDGLTLEKDPRFSSVIDINPNTSVVHIPTDVYSGGVKIVNTIKWTAGLDKYFLENKKDDPSLLWQYFGSSDGVYRVYPGFQWLTPSGEDMFDNRRRGWYIQGSSPPKDIVLVLDLSGRMLGSKLAIVKLAAMSLLETLQENDFVHVVIVYEKKPNMVCQVSEDGTNVYPIDQPEVANCPPNLIPATEQNKKFLMHFIPKVKAKGIAAVSKGVEKAIEVLKASRKEGQFTSSNCSQAIIIFTDGMEDNEALNTKEVLQKNNKDKKIRLFAYLVGRESGANNAPLQQMCAEYRGCLFTIETLSDVREKVLMYNTVLSRALGFSKEEIEPSWTPIYLDRLGLGLMITIVAPVFNRSEEFKGELLGVVGTDVALPQLADTVPSGEIGVNGYGFAINNNGFVLFHPSLRKEKNPPNIALNEVEYNKNGTTELMHRMIDRKTGSETFLNRLISKDKHRISLEEEYHFFYAPIENTSFSAAVAIPKHGLNALKVDDNTFIIDENDLKSSAKGEVVIVAPWKICGDGVPIAAESETPVYEPSYATATDMTTAGKDELKKHCDKSKLTNLLFDANLTKKMADKWILNETGILNVFVGTQGGIFRLLLSEGAEESPYQRDYVKEQFYAQAAQYSGKEEDIIVFSAPYQDASYQKEENDTISVTASSPIVLEKSGRRTIAAVVGMQIESDALQTIFRDTIDSAPEADYCDNPEDCTLRLIDEDGFVVASYNDTDNTEVGKFIGVLEGAVMTRFVNESLFKGLNFVNVQGECKKHEQDSSSARTLLNPLFAVTSYVQFWTQSVFWSLTQFNLYSFFSGNNLAMAEEEGDEEGEENGEEEMITCTNDLKFYKGVWQNRSSPFNEIVKCSESCDPFVYLAHVKNTNLRLLLVKDGCSCDDKLSIKPTEVTSDTPTARYNMYRTIPIVQTPCNDFTEEGKHSCALASSFTPQQVLIAVTLILGLSLAYNDLWR